MPAKPRKISLNLPWDIDRWLTLEAMRERRTRTAIIVIALLKYREASKRQRSLQTQGSNHV